VAEAVADTVEEAFVRDTAVDVDVEEDSEVTIS
jgi:hypothetical protein